MGDSLSPSQSSSHDIEMDDHNPLSRIASRQRLLQPGEEPPRRGGLAGVAKHTLGLILLLCVVFLWTMGNFLGSSIFADNTYAKPFFLTYLNTSMFMLGMIPTLSRSAYKRHRDRGDLYDTIRSTVLRTTRREGYKPISHEPTMQEDLEQEDSDSDAFIQKPTTGNHTLAEENGKHLGFIPTARLAFAFCILWFGANYFAMSCLQHTTVASTTILTSTSSFWTLLIGALTRTEKFTWRKLCGVLGSFVGIILISRVDLSAATDSDTGGVGDRILSMLRKRLDTFPEKSPSELALGDALALFSAILYGVYTITLKKATLGALPRSINMPLFFGMVGFFNFIFLFPLFPILHYTGLEPFSFPPTRRVWTILLINSLASLTSDVCWAYAMVFTSPLLVTVGLSLSIPLSLVGQIVLQGHYEGWVYWVGAAVVVGSFLFIDMEEKEEEEAGGVGEGRRDVLTGERDLEVQHEDDTGRLSTAQSGSELAGQGRLYSS